MAASERPRKRTASRCVPDTDQCTHVFEITGYSFLKGLGAGMSVRSATFTVGGHDWCIQYCPDGDYREEFRDYISVFLKLKSKPHGEVRALPIFRLLDQVTHLPKAAYVGEEETPFAFSREEASFGKPKFIKRSKLEASPYLRNNRLVIECDVTVIMEAPVSTAHGIHQVPPSDLPEHLGRLLKAEVGMDVSFNVGGEVFRAHKIVLAMRSPVFMAELYGPMKDNTQGQSITIEDIQPAVFRTLLQFIYTDSLPDMDDLDVDEKGEFIKHLLVPADRYAMDRLKMICEGIISKGLDDESVAGTLALADQYHCRYLKDASLEGFDEAELILC